MKDNGLTGPARLDVRLTPAGQGMLSTAREVRSGIEAEVLEQVGAQKLEAAKAALVALLTIAQQDERVRNRSVPAPQE